MVDRVIFWILGTVLFFSIAIVGTVMTTFFYDTTTVTIVEISATGITLLLLWAVSVFRPQQNR